MLKKLSLYALNLDNKRFLIIALPILLLRIIYASLFSNNIGDLGFYNAIADGLLNGCGIGTISQEGICTKVVGHFFPGFFYFIALSHKLGFGIKGLVILISLFQFYSYLHLSQTIRKYTRNIGLSKLILIITSLSPLTLGFTRQILMEPFITGIGVFYLSNLIKVFYEGLNKKSFASLLLIQLVGIYIKPTSILLIIPFLVLIFNKLKFAKFIFTSSLYIFLILLLMTPWGIRNISLGANAPFSSVIESNFMPKNSNGYISWLKSWVITEHEQAQNGFQIWHSPMNLNIQKARFNPFIAKNEIEKVNKKYKSKNQFSIEDDIYFKKLTNKRIKELSILGNFSLYSSKIISLMLNPLNSWGWPLELKSFVSDTNINFNKSIFHVFLDSKVLFLLILKLLLFTYRLIFFILFFSTLITRFKIYKFSIFKSSSLADLVSVASFLYLVGILFLFTIKYPSLEHRYISMAINWLEVSYFLYSDKYLTKYFYSYKKI